jgi:ferredoxin-NADP reductase
MNNMSEKYSAHEIDIHNQIDELRLNVYPKIEELRLIFTSFKAPSKNNFFLTFISLGVIFIINRYISAAINNSKAKTVKKAKALSALTPRTIFDKLGLFTSNLFAFVIFPVFVFINVILAQWVMKGGKIYDGKIVNIGYLLHSSSGSLYFICGGLQFYTPLRQHYPVIHRLTGYTYYLMVLLTSIGIAWISIKPHAGLSSQIATASFLPPWMVINIIALRAIAIYRDVELHRQLNILGLSFASSIVFMRPLVAVVMLMMPEWDFGRSLGLVLWVAMCWAVFGAVLYILGAYTVPTLKHPRLQHSGEVTVGSMSYPQESVPAVVYKWKQLDKRTVLLKLRSKSNYSNLPLPILPPGSHIALSIKGLVREYTPIRMTESNDREGEITIIVRLVPEGVFSTLLRSVLKDGQRTYLDCSIACNVYGPLYPLPARFGYVPSYGGDDDNSSSCPHLLLVGAGTGILPFLDIIAAALTNNRDKTKIKLIFLSGYKAVDGDNGFEEYVKNRIDNMRRKSINGRFEAQIVRERLSMKTLNDWATSPSSPAPFQEHTREIPHNNSGDERREVELKCVEYLNMPVLDSGNIIVWVCGPPGFGGNICSKMLLLENNRSNANENKQRWRLNKEQIFVLGLDDR